jgi:hypothetical protein
MTMKIKKGIANYLEYEDKKASNSKNKYVLLSILYVVLIQYMF